MRVSMRRAAGEELDSDYYTEAVLEGITQELGSRYGLTAAEVMQLMNEMAARKGIR